MILIVSFIIIVVCAAIALIKSEKPVKHVLAEAKYELLYNMMGSRAVIDDILMKGKNKTELPLQKGKFAVVTGGTRGIGLEVVKMLLKCDVHVIIGCRSVEAGKQLLPKFREEKEEEGIKTGNLDVFELDVSNLDSIKKFATVVKERYPKIHYLINNAGKMFGPYEETVEGYESQFATNYLGHFYLTHFLLENLVSAGNGSKSRIVNVSSCAHLLADVDFDDINRSKQYITSAAYAQSKLAQILFTLHLDGLMKKNGLPVQVHAVHPGIVNTDLFNGTYLKTYAPWVPSLFFKSPEQGAFSVIHAALAERLEGHGGTYISNCEVVPAKLDAYCLELQEKLFEFTKKLLKIEHFGRLE